jgi:tetratricopeptide (TPR) repeat protein
MPCLEHGRIAAILDPSDATAHAVFGQALQISGEHEAALKETTRAVALNPSNPFVQAIHGNVLAYCGQPGESLPHFEQAIRLSPLDPLRWYWLFLSSMAFYHHRDFEACVVAGRDICRMRPDVVFGYRMLVVALAELGRLDDAHRYADVLHSRFNGEMHAFLTTRWPEWREIEYANFVASLAKGGLVLRDGLLLRVN